MRPSSIPSWRSLKSSGVYTQDDAVHYHTKIEATNRFSLSMRRQRSIGPTARTGYRTLLRWIDKTQGYHFGMTWGAISCSTICLINIIVTIWAYAHYDIRGGIGKIQEGDCNETKKMTLWIHLAINVFSTLLLGTSNYAMQCFSSPTRAEVDRAHAKRVWLDIGVSSLRNLFHISRVRLALWAILGVSSIPLHLLYNSAVFSTLSARTYSVFVVTEGFLTGDPFDVPNLSNLSNIPTNIDEIFTTQDMQRAALAVERMRASQGVLQTLDNPDCLNTYVKDFVSTNADVLLVSSHEDKSNDSVLAWYGSRRPVGRPSDTYYDWIFDQEWQDCTSKACDIKRYGSAPPRRELRFPILYCLSRPVPEQCKLEVSAAIMVIVIVCNALKALVIGYWAWQRPAAPLVTLGDAIASFLKVPDSTTGRMCLFSKTRITRDPQWKPKLIAWGPKRHFWFRASGVLAQSGVIIFTTLTVLILTCLLSSGAVWTDNWNVSFGRLSTGSIVQGRLSGRNSLLLTVILANAPQLILSFVYFMYNNLFTGMLMAREWSGYAHHRKSLRVTCPEGEQRSTYFLQLPYIYGIPFLIISALLHWITSQAFFIARVRVLDENDRENKSLSLETLGYSTLGLLLIPILVLALFVATLVNGLRRYRSGMPFARNCSAAISAACHRPKEDTAAFQKPVKWGVPTEYGIRSRKHGQGYGHCCFTSFDVNEPEIGKMYAGLIE